jgi:hypothetical protein
MHATSKTQQVGRDALDTSNFGAAAAPSDGEIE